MTYTRAIDKTHYFVIRCIDSGNSSRDSPRTRNDQGLPTTKEMLAAAAGPRNDLVHARTQAVTTWYTTTTAILSDLLTHLPRHRDVIAFTPIPTPLTSDTTSCVAK